MAALYCQTCGTKNADDARYCKHCGKPIAKPGMEGGPLNDVTSAGVGRPRDPDRDSRPDDDEPKREPAADEAKEEPAGDEPEAEPDDGEDVVVTPGDRVVGDKGGAGGTIKATPKAKERADKSPVAAIPAVDAAAVGSSAEATVKGQPVRKKPRESESGEARTKADEAGTQKATPSAKGEPRESRDVGSAREEADRSRPKLSPPTGQMPTDSMVASLSIRLSEVGLQSPGRLVLLTIGVAVVLFALGAGAMFLIMRWQAGPPTAVATGEPGEERGLVIGMPVPEAHSVSEEDESEARPGGGGRRPSGGGRRPATGGGAGGEEPSGGGEGAGDEGSPARTEPGEGTEPAGGGDTVAPSGGSEPEGSGGGEPATPSGGTDPAPEGGGSPPSGLPPDDEMEERDPAMSAYAGRVRYVISRFYAARAQNCFERASREHTEPVFGTVVVRFDIGEDGNVTSASAVRNTTGSRDLAGCLTGQVRSWRLPPPPGGEVTMEMPFSQ